ncbi:expressed unknown protein [Seminavis robusta]|uniref:Uncharacterized protein n=1 Tax=Seminavis robusta TaxID=568900 RepID=A0A9N8DML6_9STRA|nr:expressed unknown protein [Seminavis robusta]|eukprot:Sro167_g074510.1 n/a (130) ;mRNA; r:60393-60782
MDSFNHGFPQKWNRIESNRIVVDLPPVDKESQSNRGVRCTNKPPSFLTINRHHDKIMLNSFRTLQSNLLEEDDWNEEREERRNLLDGSALQPCSFAAQEPDPKGPKGTQGSKILPKLFPRIYLNQRSDH